MYSVVRLSSPVLVLATLAACGGSQTPLEKLDTRIARGDAQFERVLSLSPTGAAYMPPAGSAVFNGTAGLYIAASSANDFDDVAIVGDARLTANFDNDTMTGSVTNMLGSTGDNSVSNVNGTIEIGGRESVVGNDIDDNRTNAHNEWYADYVGNLQFQGDRYAVEGALDGIFLGNRVNVNPGQSTVRGILGVDDFGSTSINGSFEEVPSSLVVFGEN